jgi:hypothetical protein
VRGEYSSIKKSQANKIYEVQKKIERKEKKLRDEKL